MVYVLFYDTDNGDRENWNTFYTPCEVFSTAAKRDARQAQLAASDPELEFHTIDVVLD